MIQTERLVSGYGKTRIIQGAQIHIGQGEIVSIVGRNGVGKSTLMKTIMGAIRPMEGTIFIRGEDFTNKKVYDRFLAGVSFVEQGHGIFPNLSVEENLKMGMNMRQREKNLPFSTLYESFPILGERKKQRAGTLSGGEQAMLSVARALVSSPEVIILDEPSEGVQPNVVQLIGEIIEDSNVNKGVTIVLVEQNLKLIQQISHRCYAIDKGRVVGELSREELADTAKIEQYLTV